MPVCKTVPESDAQDLHQLSSYDYSLPENQIAQNPAEQREQSRLLVLDCVDKTQKHTQFETVCDLLKPGDLLVVNNTKVFPARLSGNKQTGGKVEMLLLHFPISDEQQERREDNKRQATVLTLIKSSKRPKPGSILRFADTLHARVDTLRSDGKVDVTLFYPAHRNLEEVLEEYGKIPLPPYIKRPDGSTAEDAQRYQTKYARHIGSVAAPTAGLHLSDRLLRKIKARGVKLAAVTLHVGYGTFAPVRSEDIREHQLHKEFIHIPPETAAAINAVQKTDGRIWAVGTTTARTLEFAGEQMDDTGRILPTEGLCGLYIYPGYRFKVVNNLITNFHLPKSSLLFLVSALAGKKRIMEAYGKAVERGYRFFSYGDAMVIITKK
ncbi:MAG: tRNA preQ1(34) S-adenosylmethionine ribosyltransferase-isomerase QueA [Candidatus Electrothrix sp. AR4]|nr:tRNA preQ1(34) S-adenosylmethionine ribosyltransferase-isomerase QueA [Candidatus Electrothrix sp. AR4]